MFADKIKELRKLKGLSQYQLARDLKVSQPTINSWEKGNRTPTFATLQTIADYFGVSIDYLLDRDQDDVSSAHYLRHTYASILYEQDVDVRSAMYLLGHNKITTTVDIYTHISQSKIRNENIKINQYFNSLIV